ncbi:MAG: hypothetical protein IT433_05455 [Phycisphaerales bacterium]|nr:hypothetical protein [Phycisphaerales bacterium]
MNWRMAALVCAGTGSITLAQDALSSTSLKLPGAVSVHAIGQRNNEAAFFDQWQIVETPGGVWAQQDWYEGGAGFVPITLTVSDSGNTFLYDIRSRRGNRGDRYAKTGTTRVDGLATPLAWVRYARSALERGDTITETPTSGAKVVVTLSAPRMSGRSFECTINTATRELEEVRRADGSFVRYADWRDIGDGLHMPFSVEHYTPAMGQAPPLTRRYQLDHAEQVDARAPLPPFPLPLDAVVVDDRTGEVTDGAGRRLNVDAAALPPVPVPMASPIPLNPGAAAPNQPTNATRAADPPPSGLMAERVGLALGAGLVGAGLVMYVVRRRAHKARRGGQGNPQSQAL